MWEDPIVEEIRQVREEHAAKFKHDLQAIYQDIKEQEKKSERAFVSYPPRYCTHVVETKTVEHS